MLTLAYIFLGEVMLRNKGTYLDISGQYQGKIKASKSCTWCILFSM